MCLLCLCASLSVSLSMSLSVSVSVPLSVSLSMPLSVSICVYSHADSLIISRNSNGTFKVAIRQMFTRLLGWGVPMALVSKSVESVLDTCGIIQVDKVPSHGTAPFA